MIHDLKGLALKELEAFVLSLGEQRYRGKQLFDWMYTREAATFDEMTTFSKQTRERLSSSASIGSIKPVATKSSSDGTTKFLFELRDGKKIESVLIPPRAAFVGKEAVGEEEQRRLTLCVSTQVGCPLDCSFCATASMGLLRNLTAGEIVDQLIQAKKLSGKKITNLVYMGMGEPLLNYDNVMKSVEIITTGMGIAARRVTVSTAGWAPKIRQMADEGRKVKLAISLHSLDDKSRTGLMPINAKYPLSELMDAAKYYYSKLKQRITFEYILFDGWNDGEQDIARLIKLCKSLPSKINIIPFHNIDFTHPAGVALQLKPASKAKINAFVDRLRSAHVTVFVRSSAGEEIDAACGQLAVAHEKIPKASRNPQLT